MSYAAEFEDFQATAIREGHLESAIPDAWQDFGTYDGPMIDFHKERKETHPHRYKSFVPAADNVEHAAFFSLSGQGEFLKKNGEAATVALLKTQGLKLGQVKPAKADDLDEFKGGKNPFSPEFLKKHTAAEQQARISSIIKSGGTRLAASLARSAGVTITGQKLQPVGQRR